MSGEFKRIETYFRPLAGLEGLSLLDDASLISPPEGVDLVVTKDILIENVHFLSSDPADTLARKALAVNLSDLAAKGADPYLYYLGLAVPSGVSDDWFAAFAQGLADMQDTYSLSLAGGDTTRSPDAIMLSITLIGTVPKGGMIQRSTARVGDLVCVSGTLGDGALGLLAAQGNIPANQHLLENYQRPVPRQDMVPIIRKVATASADISDGLLADLGHICTASGVGAVVRQAALPISDDANAVLASMPEYRPLIWSGGDDYELVFTVPAQYRAELESGHAAVSIIGEIIDGAEVTLLDLDNNPVKVSRSGFQHF
ncbi:thiamine-monophosphate kinase [Kordiimonas sediminis]|uniref:Thiamine-monophosphate kinase n=1 Tax=Kordiimonas sediminis TaxID=1735581 RepID=A0A919AWX6_9PROT|nr:thiamine-phosphate kinase [Kordiimonas sediminis]GHF29091.1 thiamine-monophosphate kinase [Kordiimonas sediminis]